jgi:hypothetical protein
MDMCKADKGKLFNNKGVYRGQFDRADLQMTEGRIRGQLVGTVFDGGVTAGHYTCDLDGLVVGHSFMGIFTTHLGDQSKTGYFVGTLHP